MARKLPMRIQSFERLRRGGFVYVDKTESVHTLAHAGTPFFLSRPHRFGKSLLASTLRAYFEGRRELFEGLAIERLEGEGTGAWRARPVFHFDLDGADYAREGVLEGTLDAMLKSYEEVWGCTGPGMPFGLRLYRLLELAHERRGQRVAVLVDEYDKPLLDSMHDPGLEERNRATLRGFYSALKSADEHLYFVLVTGATTFCRLSLGDALNHLNDITLSREYAGVCGITEGELLDALGPELHALADTVGMSNTECLEALRAQYGGYRFHPSGPAVHNPLSRMKALSERELASSGLATATPTFLARRMQGAGLDPRRLTDGTLYVSERRLSGCTANDQDLIPLLYQTGCLTIRDYDARLKRYTLAVPNAEVERCLKECLLPAWTPVT